MEELSSNGLTSKDWISSELQNSWIAWARTSCPPPVFELKIINLIYELQLTKKSLLAVTTTKAKTILIREQTIHFEA